MDTVNQGWGKQPDEYKYGLTRLIAIDLVCESFIFYGLNTTTRNLILQLSDFILLGRHILWPAKYFHYFIRPFSKKVYLCLTIKKIDV